MKDNWISVEDKMPDEYEVVLTQHVDDLYPVSAYWFSGYSNEVKLWMRETEGPEDIIIQGRYKELFRDPTHWQPLPPPPKGDNYEIL